MRKILIVGLIACLISTVAPSASQAGDSHAVRNRWAGTAIGAGAVILGGIILDALYGPARVFAAPPAVVAPPPPVYYAPPPVVYVPPPVVVYPTPPPVLYAPAPVAVYYGWAHPGHGKKWHRGHWKHE